MEEYEETDVGDGGGGGGGEQRDSTGIHCIRERRNYVKNRNAMLLAPCKYTFSL